MVPASLSFLLLIIPGSALYFNGNNYSVLSKISANFYRKLPERKTEETQKISYCFDSKLK